MKPAPANRPFPLLSLSGALVTAVAIIALGFIQAMPLASESMADRQTRVFYVMLGMLIAFLASSVSLVTAWCPIILGRDKRPWYWVAPLVVGWLAFVQVFDWRWILPEP